VGLAALSDLTDRIVLANLVVQATISILPALSVLENLVVQAALRVLTDKINLATLSILANLVFQPALNVLTHQVILVTLSVLGLLVVRLFTILEKRMYHRHITHRQIACLVIALKKLHNSHGALYGL
jgi:hypothetical protein